MLLGAYVFAACCACMCECVHDGMRDRQTDRQRVGEWMREPSQERKRVRERPCALWAEFPRGKEKARCCELGCSGRTSHNPPGSFYSASSPSNFYKYSIYWDSIDATWTHHWDGFWLLLLGWHSVEWEVYGYVSSVYKAGIIGGRRLTS